MERVDQVDLVRTSFKWIFSRNKSNNVQHMAVRTDVIIHRQTDWKSELKIYVHEALIKAYFSVLEKQRQPQFFL